MQLRPYAAEASCKSQDKTVKWQYLDSALYADKVAFLFLFLLGVDTYIG